VTAGLANEVDDVNQYPAVIYKPTVYGIASTRAFKQPKMVAVSPKVATNSATHYANRTQKQIFKELQKLFW